MSELNISGEEELPVANPKPKTHHRYRCKACDTLIEAPKDVVIAALIKHQKECVRLCKFCSGGVLVDKCCLNCGMSVSSGKVSRLC